MKKNVVLKFLLALNKLGSSNGETKPRSCLAAFSLVDLLEEVQEVHSVHGTIDILIKIVIQRDFLASDAEIIAEFVDQRIRRIGGITRTQTVIPGISKVKEGFIV